MGVSHSKGDPAYAIVVDGKEVARGEVDWAKDTEGAEKLYGNEGKNDVDNSQVKWKDISFDYDFSDGMPQKVEVRFLNDACGGHDPKAVNGRIATSSLIRSRLMDFRSRR